MADAALRQILMLRQIPRAPRKITTQALREYLRGTENIEVTERTIQRDLTALADHLPLQCDDRNKPFGWCFRNDADLSIAAMDANTAITLDMVQRFLAQLMPAQALESLRPQLNAAQKHLENAQGHGKTRWSQKVAVLPRGLPLQPAAVQPAVLEAIYQALLHERALDIQRARGKQDRIHPLGIVHRGPVIYLVCGFYGYPDVRQLAVHRIHKATVLDEARRVPEQFSGLQAYIDSGEFSYRAGERPLKLKLRFYDGAGEHLKETPMAADQQIKDDNGEGTLTVQATVADTWELRWWLQGFGGGVEVLKPGRLRREFADLAKTLQTIYSND